MKGYKVKLANPAFPPDILAVDNNTTFHTLELAILLQYDFSSSPGHAFIKLGPSIDFQLFGKETFRLPPRKKVVATSLWGPTSPAIADFGSASVPRNDLE